MRGTGTFPIRVLDEHDLEHGERLTLVAMYSLAGSDDIVWHGTTQLAEKMGYALRTIQKHLRSLSDSGWIERVSRPDPRGGGSFHGYRLMRPLRRK